VPPKGVADGIDPVSTLAVQHGLWGTEFRAYWAGGLELARSVPNETVFDTTVRVRGTLSRKWKRGRCLSPGTRAHRAPRCWHEAS
jgi:hypothetical protein